jgi:hypothetical protein
VDLMSVSVVETVVAARIALEIAVFVVVVD